MTAPDARQDLFADYASLGYSLDNHPWHCCGHACGASATAVPKA